MTAQKTAPAIEQERADAPQFYGHELFEHYQEDGYLLLVTSDEEAVRLEPGDYIVKRVWSTAVVPYIYAAKPLGSPEGSRQ